MTDIKRYRSRAEAIAVRTDACRFAAQVMAGRDEPFSKLWSVAVFFESYIAHGSKWTARDFGPRPPVKLEPTGREEKST